MTEEEFLRQVTAAPGLKKGYITSNRPQSIAFRLVPMSESIAILRGSYENETGRFFVSCPESGKSGTGKTLQEAIKDLNKKLPSGRQILHPAARGFRPDATELEQIQWLRDIAESMVDPHWQNYPADSEEFKNGQRAAVLTEVFDGMVEASRAALLRYAETCPQYSDALESLRYNSGKTYRLLFGEDLP